jgi:arginine deiminase
MALHMLLIIEDDPNQVMEVLRFIGGTELQDSFTQQYPDFMDDFPGELMTVEILLKAASKGALFDALQNYLGRNLELKVVIIGSKELCDTYLQDAANPENTLLSFLDLNIPGAEEVPVSDQQAQTIGIAFSVFEDLLNRNVPVFVLSSFLQPTVYEKLQEIARGRLFSFYHKAAFRETIEASGDALRSQANFLASLVFNKPFYHVSLRLRLGFKRDFLGSRAIANELSLLEHGGYEKHPGEYEEEEGILNDLRANNATPDLGAMDEVSTLKSVLLHQPGLEAELVDPKNCDDLLFNQPVNTRKFIEQYGKFRAIIGAVTRFYEGNLFSVRGLLKELLQHQRHSAFLRAKFALELVKADKSPQKFWSLLNLCTGDSVDQLIDVAIAGTTTTQREERSYFAPIVNFMFTRDWGFTVHNKVFLSNMNKPARVREKAIAEFLFKYHPMFQNVFDSEKLSLSSGTIEGGDVILASPETILVGLSERTEFEAVQEFAKIVFEQVSGIKKIIATPAPREHPKSMHLDTFIGFLETDTVLLDEDILVNKTNPHFILRQDQPIELRVGRFIDVLEEELAHDGIDLKAIPVSDRNEQYDDACNIFTVSPGKSLIYERVPNTIKRVCEHGWQEEEFDFEFDENDTPSITAEGENRLARILADDTKKVLIKVPGDELSLARGGPHCMTFPLSRRTSNENG